MMSGGPIRKFTEGWAVRIFNFGRAHYFVRDEVGIAKASCGRDRAPTAMLRHPGNWKRCKLCERNTALTPRDCGV